MGDEEDGFSFFCEVLHDLHQLVDFLRRQNRGRLVEDQDFVVTVEHFQNFGTLLHADGDIRDQSVRIDHQTVFLAQFHDFCTGILFLEEKAFGRLYAEDDVVENRETFDQLKVLVHHTDVEIIGVVRRVDMDFLPILLDDSGGRLIQTKKNTHQG